MSAAAIFPELSPAQQAVLDAVAAGASKTDAARAANVHRDTINDWEHHTPGFKDAVLNAQNTYRHQLASQMRRLSVVAVSQLEQLLHSPDTPPAVRLRAIQLVLTRPRFPDKEWALPENLNPPEIQELQNHFNFFEADYRAGLQEDQLRREQSKTNHILNQQSGIGTQPANRLGNVGNVGNVGNTEAIATAETGKLSHSGAPPSTTRGIPARNALCPCGSGQKFKRCCGKSAPPLLGIPHAA